MLKFLFSRILLVIPVLLGITVVVFTLIYLTPGDPAMSMLGENATPELVAKIHEQLGLDDGYVVRLGRYIKGVCTLDFGISYRTKRPVLDEILQRYPYTLILTFGSVGLGILIGIIAGIVSAVWQYSWLDKILTTFSLFGVSAPSFWIAMILVLVFSVNLRLLPATGYQSFRHWILPIFTMGLQCSAYIMRMTRSSMLEVIRQDYVRTARAKGQSEFLVITRHAFRNALVPIITIIGIQICGFLAGAVLVETVFALPGLGRLIVDSVGYKDYPLVQGGVLWIGLNCVLINLLTDILYCFVDPRIKSEYNSLSLMKWRKKKTISQTEQTAEVSAHA